VLLKALLSANLVSRRAGNYRYCRLAGATGIVSACLDQLWCAGA
jgi:hypothetical protein